MRRDLTVRKTKTASGATAVQVVRNVGKRREILRHIGSAHDEQTLVMLLSEAEHYAEHHRVQPSLFASDQPAPPIVNLDHTTLITVTHRFAREAFNEPFNLVLHDANRTLYFESFKEYDSQSTNFSKGNKPQQPQIVIGMITTRSGFPVMHEVFEGKTFEGHTMLKILERFQQCVGYRQRSLPILDRALQKR